MVAITAGGDGRLDMGRVISRTFGVVGRNSGTLLALTAILSIGPQILSTWGQAVLKADSTGLGAFAWIATVVGGLVSLVGTYLLQAAITRCVVGDLNGKRVSVGTSLSVSTQSILPLFFLAIVTGLGLMLGLALLIVPGLILMVRWSVAAPAVVSERKDVSDAMRRSADLTKGHRWAVFGLMLVYVVAYYAIVVGIAGLTIAAPGAVDGVNLINVVLIPVLLGLTSMVGAAGVAALYCELRSAKEGAEPSALAAVFD